MNTVFNADEMFEMAEQMERDGAAFYTAALRRANDSKIRELLNLLRRMEENHLKTFSVMRKAFAAKTPQTFDPDGAAAQYLQAFARNRIYDNENLVTRLTGKESLDAIFATAVSLEKDSITFYLGMKELVPENLGKNEIENIIKEEMSHITYLAAERERLSRG